MSDLKITCHDQELDDNGKCKTCGRVYDFTIKVTEPKIEKLDQRSIFFQAVFKTSLIIVLMFILYFILK